MSSRMIVITIKMLVILIPLAIIICFDVLFQYVLQQCTISYYVMCWAEVALLFQLHSRHLVLDHLKLILVVPPLCILFIL